jgi:hypothetical protein
MALMILSVVIGGLITWAAAHIYYRRASKELEKESRDLRRLNKLILEGLETAGHIRIARDKDGEISGLRFDLKANGVSAGVPKLGTPTLSEGPPLR